MKSRNRITGNLAENEACEVLKRKGFKILKRNFRNRFGEIDIIAKDDDITVFVEVKAKTGTFLGSPEEMVDKRKLSKIRNMAQAYLNGLSVPCRIDVVAVVFSTENTIERLTHYENVY